MTISNTNGRIVPSDYAVDENGVWRKLGEKRPPLRLTTSAVYVTALFRDINAADWTVEIKFTNPDGQACILLVPYFAIIGRRDLVQLCAAEGLFVLPRGESEFAEYLAQCAGDPDLPRHRLTSKLGLNLLPDEVCPDRLAFVLPEQTLLPVERLSFRPLFSAHAYAAYTHAGSLEDSRELLTKVRTDPVAIFVQCSALTAPFLEIAGIDTIIVHLHGRSSTGKTFRLQAAASLWGKPLDPQTAGNDVTLIERWHGTANSMENLAAVHNGMTLYLDELGGNTDLDFSVYNSTSGRGKNRMTRDGGVQAQRKWSELILSSGEVSLTDRLEASTGKPAKTGEVIRGLNIPLDGLTAYPEMTTEEASQHVQKLKSDLASTYGTIGPAFAQFILDTFGTASALRDELQLHIEVKHARLIEKARDEGHPLEAPHIRALRRFALIAVIGEWAADEFLPFTVDEIEVAVDLVAMTWLGSLPALNDEDRIVGQVRDWIVRHLGQMIVYGDHADNDAPYIPSVTKGIRHKRWVLLTETDFAEACAGTPPMVAGKILKRQGILDCEEGKHKKRHLLGGLGLPLTFYYSIVMAKLLPQTELAESIAAGPIPTTGLGPRLVEVKPVYGDDDDLEAVPNF